MRKSMQAVGAIAIAVASVVAAPALAQAKAPPRGGGPALPVGEYACTGSGGSILAGMGFKLLPGGRYTDLDGKSPGRYAVTGTSVTFTGGHLGGQTGRDIKARGFTIGRMVSCQLWG